MERELLMTGIGGQGVQLAARVLAEAAVAEGREVCLFGSYGGMMRGGNTDTTLVIADDAIGAPPVISSTWSAIVMHHDYADDVWSMLRPDGLVFVNSTVVQRRPDDIVGQVVDVAASDLAVDVGNIMTATMVMLGAYVSVTGIVAVDSVKSAIAETLPSYRRQHIDLNIAAVQAGVEACEARVPAWAGVA